MWKTEIYFTMVHPSPMISKKLHDGNKKFLFEFRMYKYALFNNATLCMRAPLFKQMAQSTAFRIPDYDLVSNPKNYSLWTESGKISLPKPIKSSIKILSEWAYLTQSRIYLVESPVKQNVSLSLGIISLFFAFLIAWTMKWKVSHLLVRITCYCVFRHPQSSSRVMV